MKKQGTDASDFATTTRGIEELDKSPLTAWVDLMLVTWLFQETKAVKMLLKRRLSQSCDGCLQIRLGQVTTVF